MRFNVLRFLPFVLIMLFLVWLAAGHHFRNLSSQNYSQSAPQVARVDSRINTILENSGYTYSYYFDDFAETPPPAPDHNMLRSASLLKLPQVMDLYRPAEAGKIDLNQPVTLQPQWLDRRYGDLRLAG